MGLKPQRLLHDSLLESAERYPEKEALVVEGRSYTYAELLNAVRRFAGTLVERGVKRGDRVAIYMDNTWECAVAIFGTSLAGGVFLVVNPQTKADKLAYVLNDSGATLLATDGHLGKVFGPVLERVDIAHGVICSGRMPTRPKVATRIDSFDEILASTDPLLGTSGAISVDLAALIYTSGSTGDPKGVMMTHQSMVFTVESLVEYLRLSDDHRILGVLPLAFDYGLYQLLMCVRVAATLVLERSFTYPAQIINRMNEQQVTVFPGVPTIYSMLLSMHKKRPLCFPSVRRVTNTAAALPADFLPNLKEIFPNALIFAMYGLTECKRVSYLEPELLDQHPTSVGKAIPGTEVFLLDENGEPVPPGETGILHVRGAHVMQGYWNKPEQSAEMIKPGKFPGDRILCCKDHFRTDEEGFLYFVGRSDDIIKTRGEKVSPIEVENALHGIPSILEAAVIGIPDDLLGSAIRAYVVLERGVQVTERQIIKECMVRLENFMVPKEVIFLDELPKTMTGKIQKKGLLEKAAK